MGVTKPVKLFEGSVDFFIEDWDREPPKVVKMVPYEGDYDIIDFEPYEESDAS